jgi:hypothetical protein
MNLINKICSFNKNHETTSYLLNKIEKKLDKITNIQSHSILYHKNEKRMSSAISALKKCLTKIDLHDTENEKKINNQFENLFQCVSSNKYLKNSQDHLIQLNFLRDSLIQKMEIHELEKELAHCQNSLSKSENPALSLDERIKNTPKPTQGGFLSVSYFLSNENAAGEMEKKFVVKPAKLETDRELLLHCPAFSKGSGVLRERLAYVVQQELQLNCGIPQTIVTTLNHTMFGNADSIPARLQEFARVAGIRLNLHQIVEISLSSENKEKTILEHINSYQKEELLEMIAKLDSNTQQLLIDYFDTGILYG